MVANRADPPEGPVLAAVAVQGRVGSRLGAPWDPLRGMSHFLELLSGKHLVGATMCHEEVPWQPHSPSKWRHWHSSPVAGRQLPPGRTASVPCTMQGTLESRNLHTLCAVPKPASDSASTQHPSPNVCAIILLTALACRAEFVWAFLSVLVRLWLAATAGMPSQSYHTAQPGHCSRCYSCNDRRPSGWRLPDTRAPPGPDCIPLAGRQPVRTRWPALLLLILPQALAPARPPSSLRGRRTSGLGARRHLTSGPRPVPALAAPSSLLPLSFLRGRGLIRLGLVWVFIRILVRLLLLLLLLLLVRHLCRQRQQQQRQRHQ